MPRGRRPSKPKSKFSETERKHISELHKYTENVLEITKQINNDITSATMIHKSALLWNLTQLAHIYAWSMSAAMRKQYRIHNENNRIESMRKLSNTSLDGEPGAILWTTLINEVTHLNEWCDKMFEAIAQDDAEIARLAAEQQNAETLAD